MDGILCFYLILYNMQFKQNEMKGNSIEIFINESHH